MDSLLINQMIGLVLVAEGASDRQFVGLQVPVPGVATEVPVAIIAVS